MPTWTRATLKPAGSIRRRKPEVGASANPLLTISTKVRRMVQLHKSKHRLGRSPRFDRPHLRGAPIYRDDRKVALSLDRQAAKVIHDRLPFLDLSDGPLVSLGVDAGIIHRVRRRQQVRSVAIRGRFQGLDL